MGLNEDLILAAEKMHAAYAELREATLTEEELVALIPLMQMCAMAGNGVQLLAVEKFFKQRAAKIEREGYEEKLEYVRQWNMTLRAVNGALAHPETSAPCILLAVSSYDGQGRYTLENRETKKRSGSYKSLRELPVRVVPDLPRKGPNTERRKKGGKKKGEQE